MKVELDLLSVILGENLETLRAQCDNIGWMFEDNDQGIGRVMINLKAFFMRSAIIFKGSIHMI